MPEKMKKLTYPEVAERLGVSAPTIRRMVGKRAFPEPSHIGSRVFWYESVIDDYEKKKIEESRKSYSFCTVR